MSVVLTVFIILASLLMIGIVLVQKSKGGGLASNFASSNQIMGVRKTTDFVEKATMDPCYCYHGSEHSYRIRFSQRSAIFRIGN